MSSPEYFTPSVKFHISVYYKQVGGEFEKLAA